MVRGKNLLLEALRSVQSAAGAHPPSARGVAATLVERDLVATQMECGVLERTAAAGGGVEAAPPGEILYTRSFYDYEAKYDDSGTKLVLHPDLSPGISEQAQGLAVAAFAASDSDSSTSGHTMKD